MRYKITKTTAHCIYHCTVTITIATTTPSTIITVIIATYTSTTPTSPSQIKLPNPKQSSCSFCSSTILMSDFSFMKIAFIPVPFHILVFLKGRGEAARSQQSSKWGVNLVGHLDHKNILKEHKEHITKEHIDNTHIFKTQHTKNQSRPKHIAHQNEHTANKTF